MTRLSRNIALLQAKEDLQGWRHRTLRVSLQNQWQCDPQSSPCHHVKLKDPLAPVPSPRRLPRQPATGVMISAVARHRPVEGQLRDNWYHRGHGVVLVKVVVLSDSRLWCRVGQGCGVVWVKVMVLSESWLWCRPCSRLWCHQGQCCVVKVMVLSGSRSWCCLGQGYACRRGQVCGVVWVKAVVLSRLWCCLGQGC